MKNEERSQTLRRSVLPGSSFLLRQEFFFSHSNTSEGRLHGIVLSGNVMPYYSLTYVVRFIRRPVNCIRMH